MTSRPQAQGKAPLIALVILAALGAGVLGFFALKKAQSASQPTAPVKTEADWENVLMNLQERVTQSAQMTGVSVSPLIQEVKDFVDQAPQKGAGFQLLGQLHLLTGDFAKAYDAFAKAIPNQTPNAELQQLAGTAAYQTGDYNQAALHYKQALDLTPDSSQARLFLAEALIERNQENDRQEALLLLTDAINLDDSLHAAFFRLSGLQLKLNNPNSALDNIRKALTRVDKIYDPEPYWRYQLQQARVLMRLRDYVTARSLLNAHPNSNEEPILSDLATCDMQLGEPLIAAARYDKKSREKQLPDAHDLERAAHWYLIAGKTNLAKPFINSYQSHPKRNQALANSLSKRLSQARDP